MKVIKFFESDRKAHWLAEIKKSDWRASAFLHRLLSENTFFDVMGERSEVLLLTDGDDLISHCTFAERDDIQPTDLTPWVGFVYTFPKYRGHRYAGLLFDEIERLSKSRGIPVVYLSTNHIGLYEKYGFEFLDMMNDIDGEPSRVYVKRFALGDNIEIERIADDRILEALALAWKVFLEYESPDYSPEGTEEFKKCLHDENYLSGIEYYGAFYGETLIGTIGIRAEKRHICFFFVDDNYHRQGIGTALFRNLLKDYPSETITLNSSPYGVPFYKALGFVPTDKEQTVNGIRFTPMRFG